MLGSTMELLQEMKKECEAGATHKCASEMLCKVIIAVGDSGTTASGSDTACPLATSSQPFARTCNAPLCVQASGGSNVAVLSHGASRDQSPDQMPDMLHDPLPATTSEHREECANVLCPDAQLTDPLVGQPARAPATHDHALAQNLQWLSCLAAECGGGDALQQLPGPSACSGRNAPGHELQDQLSPACTVCEVDSRTPQPLQCTMASPSPYSLNTDLPDAGGTAALGTECENLAAGHADEILDDLKAQLLPASEADQAAEPVRCAIPPGEKDAISMEVEVADEVSMDVHCEYSIVSSKLSSPEGPCSPSAVRASPAQANTQSEANRRRPAAKAVRNVKATLPASRSSDRHRSTQQANFAPRQGRPSTSCSETPQRSTSQRRRGCSGNGEAGHQRVTSAASSSALAWKPAGKHKIQASKNSKNERCKCSHTQERTETQCTGQDEKSQPSRRVKNMKENNAMQVLAPGVDLNELKGCSRMPVLKKWDAHDFAVAQRLGFSLEEHVRRHGKPQDDESVTHSWTDVESVMDNQVADPCTEI